VSACQRCGANRVADMTVKCSDRCYVQMEGDERDHQGYAPRDMGIGGGDYVYLFWCLECGQIQEDENSGAKFPLPPCKLEAP